MTNPHLTGGQDLRIGFLLLNKFTLAAFSGLIDALRLAATEIVEVPEVEASVNASPTSL